MNKITLSSIRLNFESNDTIYDIAEVAIKLAKEYDCVVVFEFNNTEMQCDKNSYVGHIVNSYFHKREIVR